MPKVTLVDDDLATEQIVERLHHSGYDARRLKSVDEALANMDEILSSDLVILDLIMERSQEAADSISGNLTTGLDVLRRIRDSRPEMPVLVFSGTNDSGVIEFVRGMPNTSFLSKWSTPSLRDFYERVSALVKSQTKPRAFIVHGHDDVEKLSLKNYLQNSLGFSEPVILHEMPSFGRTIIEKLEDYALETDCAFVLLTPDDKIGGTESDNNAKRRARQNVIFELGYFLGIYGRQSGRVFLLFKGDLDIPSDLSGVIYINIGHGVEAAGEQIRRELRNVVG